MTSSHAAGWRQVGICAMLLAAQGMITSTYSVIAVPLGREFHPSRTVLMLAMTLLSGVGALLTPFAGALMDRVSLRKLMAAGSVGLSAGYLAISFAASFQQVLLIFALLIAPANVLIGPVAVTVLLTRWFRDRRGRALGIAIAGISVGGSLFPLIVQGLLDANQWRDALRLTALVLFLWTVPATLLIADRPAEPLDPAAPPPAVGAGAKTVSARDVLSDPAFWMIAVTVAIVTSGMKGMVTNLAPLAVDTGIAPTDAAKLLSLFAACSFVAKLSFAALADRIGPRILMFAALGGVAAGMACLTQAALGFGTIALGVSLLGLLGGLMVPIESYIAPRMFGTQAVGRAMGLLTGVILVALLSTPPLFGLIFDLTGSYRGIFWTFCGLALAAMLWLPAIRLHPRGSPVESADSRLAGVRREAGVSGLG